MRIDFEYCMIIQILLINWPTFLILISKVNTLLTLKLILNTNIGILLLQLLLNWRFNYHSFSILKIIEGERGLGVLIFLV